MAENEINNQEYDELEQIKRKKMREMMEKSAEPDKKSIPQEVVHINSAEHFNEIVNGYPDSLIVVDLWAEWCGPCKAFGPIFEATQKEYVDKDVIFLKVNVDEHQGISQQFQVRGIPTTVYIKGNKIVHKQPGMLPKGSFSKILDQILEKTK